MKRAAIRVATLSLLLLAALHFTSLAAHAAEGGYTNYFPGFYGDFGIAVAPDPGPYFTQYLYGYTYNTENNATDYQTGQELHLDFMFNKYLSAASGIGIQGFVYQQTTGDSGSGAVLGPFKGEAAGIGPAVMFAKEYKREKGLKALVFAAKWLHEFHAKTA